MAKIVSVKREDWLSFASPGLPGSTGHTCNLLCPPSDMVWSHSAMQSSKMLKVVVAVVISFFDF